MNTDERRIELLNKANSLIDLISDNMRTIENVEGAKKRFLRADSELSLEIPIQGTGGMSDVFKLKEIFDEKGIEKIKAYILTELEFLEENALRILDTAGIREKTETKAAGFVEQRPDNVPHKESSEAAGEKIPFTDWEDVKVEDPEEDSDMIVVPDKLERKAGHSTKPLTQDKVEQIQKLTQQGMKPSEIARKTGVSHQSVTRYSKKFSENTDNKEIKKNSGRSVSR